MTARKRKRNARKPYDSPTTPTDPHGLSAQERIVAAYTELCRVDGRGLDECIDAALTMLAPLIPDAERTVIERTIDEEFRE